MCECVTKINKQLQEGYEDDKSCISEVICVIDNKFLSFPALTAHYRPKKKDGSYGKQKDVSIRPSFCPFCGTKYIQEVL